MQKVRTTWLGSDIGQGHSPATLSWNPRLLGVRGDRLGSPLEGEGTHQSGRQTAMADTKTSGQSVRRQARQTPSSRKPAGAPKTAERDKRIDTAAINLMVALRERDVLEQRVGVAIRAMLSEGLTLADVVTLDPRRDQPQGSPPSRRPHRRGEPVMTRDASGFGSVHDSPAQISNEGRGRLVHAPRCYGFGPRRNSLVNAQELPGL